MGTHTPARTRRDTFQGKSTKIRTRLVWKREELLAALATCGWAVALGLAIMHLVPNC
jgi:hypothetical protein